MSKNKPKHTSQIGTLNEKPLHAALKAWYAQPGDQQEVPLQGFVVDIVRDDLLIEIQTGNFSSMKRKLRTLVKTHPVQLVYPVAQEKWIVKLPKQGEGDTPTGRRKSPKRGRVEGVFRELVSFPDLLNHPNFTLEVVLIQEEELRRPDAKHGWRKHGWVTEERRLVSVVTQRRFETSDDMQHLLPENLAEPFTTAELASVAKLPRRLAGQMIYCLRKMAVLTSAGKRGRAPLYTRKVTGNS